MLFGSDAAILRSEAQMQLKSSFKTKNCLLQPSCWCSLPASSPTLLLVVPIIILNANRSFLTLLEPLVFTIRPITVLNHHGRVRHLLEVSILFVPPIIVLNDNGSCPLLVLLLLLTTFVRSVRFLYDFCGLIQFPLFSICDMKTMQ